MACPSFWPCIHALSGNAPGSLARYAEYAGHVCMASRLLPLPCISTRPCIWVNGVRAWILRWGTPPLLLLLPTAGTMLRPTRPLYGSWRLTPCDCCLNGYGAGFAKFPDGVACIQQCDALVNTRKWR